MDHFEMGRSIQNGRSISKWSMHSWMGLRISWTGLSFSWMSLSKSWMGLPKLGRVGGGGVSVFGIRYSVFGIRYSESPCGHLQVNCSVTDWGAGWSVLERVGFVCARSPSRAPKDGGSGSGSRQIQEEFGGRRKPVGERTAPPCAHTGTGAHKTWQSAGVCAHVTVTHLCPRENSCSRRAPVCA